VITYVVPPLSSILYHIHEFLLFFFYCGFSHPSVFSNIIASVLTHFDLYFCNKHFPHYFFVNQFISEFCCDKLPLSPANSLLCKKQSKVAYNTPNGGTTSRPVCGSFSAPDCPSFFKKTIIPYLALVD